MPSSKSGATSWLRYFLKNGGLPWDNKPAAMMMFRLGAHERLGIENGWAVKWKLGFWTSPQMKIYQVSCKVLMQRMNIVGAEICVLPHILRRLCTKRIKQSRASETQGKPRASWAAINHAAISHAMCIPNCFSDSFFQLHAGRAGVELNWYIRSPPTSATPLPDSTQYKHAGTLAKLLCNY